MIEIKGVDKEKCIKCLKCVKACPVNLFQKSPTKVGKKRQVKFSDSVGICIMCGHCVAICPTDAVVYESEEPFEEFDGIKEPSKICSYDTFMRLTRSRRSIRQYKDKEVKEKDIEAVLTAMKYAPSSRNAQKWQYAVVQDQEVINHMRQATIKMLKLLKKLLKYGKYLKFLLPKRYKTMIEDPTREHSLDRQLEELERGGDHIFYNAPVVIVIYSSVYGSEIMAGNDAGIAFSHGMQAAQTRGLGTCWIGYAQEAINRTDDLKEELNIDEEMTITGVMVLGHPAAEYRKVPPREPLKIRWI
ncbi:MAG: nitroreductase family protein [Promethearchaeia archaeon]